MQSNVGNVTFKFSCLYENLAASNSQNGRVFILAIINTLFTAVNNRAVLRLLG